MTKLLLIRHAQSANNFSDDVIYEQYRDDPRRAHEEAARARVLDPQLSEIGRAQAEQLAESLLPIFDEHRVLLVSSPMLRALQTAMPMVVGAKLPRERFICHAELFEIGNRYLRADAPPSSRLEQLEADYPLSCQAVPADEQYADDGRECSQRARARVDRVIAWFEALLARDEYDVVIAVAHGNLITQWLRRWIGVPWGRGLAFVHANAGVTMLDWNRWDGLLLEYVNDESHLDPELQTGGHSSGWWGYTLPDLEIEHFDGWSMIPTELRPELVALRQHLLAADGKSIGDYADIDERNVHIVARAEGVLAGYVQYDILSGRLRQLIVAPTHRRGRLGRRLIAEVEAEAAIDGREELRVHAWVDSVEFYRAHGFVAEGAVEAGPGVPWQAMVKALPRRK
jgi:2,3-bisphosphoglycerate-dependent phosphoglycerate mutase